MESQNQNKAPGLDKTGEWFRDLLMKLLGWGTATFIVMAGWLLPSRVEISFFTGNLSDFYRALGLIIFSSGFWVTWFFLVNKIRQKCPDHPTVIKKGFVLGYSTAIIAAVCMLIGFVLID